MLDRIKTSLILGSGVYQKIKMVFLCFLFPVLRRLKINYHYFVVTIKRKENKIKINLFSSTDIALLKEIFIDEEYLTEEKDVSVIVDIGGNVGISALYFNLTYPKAKIFVFEPDQNTFKKLQINTGNISNVKCYNYAVSIEEGRIPFFINEKSNISSSIIERNGAQKREVDSINFEKLFKLIGGKIDILKFDIEGYEYQLFKNKIPDFKFAIGEYHEDIVGVSVNNFLSLFSNRSTSFEKLSNKRYIVKIR